jgi:hypothetical protein
MKSNMRLTESDRQIDELFVESVRKLESRFIDSDRRLEKHFMEVEDTITKRFTEIDESFNKCLTDSDLNLERHSTDSEIRQSALISNSKQLQDLHLITVKHAAGLLESWKQEFEGAVDDLKLKMSKLTKYMD